MLIGISPMISPELIKTLMEMGHGDEIVLADGNFPAASHSTRVIQADGHGTVLMLEAILQLFPLDTYVTKPTTLMQVLPNDPIETPIWEDYANLLRQHGAQLNPFEFLDRQQFYERAQKAYAIVATSESALYANIILKKGVIVK